MVALQKVISKMSSSCKKVIPILWVLMSQVRHHGSCVQTPAHVSDMENPAVAQRCSPEDAVKE
jgi:hypothetical protein